ncbi:hypothetical protein [Novosphingobium sp.]|uniref:hypothetical protein n=1 Tax=Novosphingobium sp. TaxID=1874826 RepID=UPI003D6C9BA4
MNIPQSATTGLPNVMIDALKLGLAGMITSTTSITPADLRNKFTGLGPDVTLSTPKTKSGNPDYMQVTLALRAGDGEEFGTAKLDLYFAPHANGLRLTKRSALTMNPQKWIRRLLGGDATCGPIGLDGNSNVLGAAQNLSVLLADAIELVAEALGHAVGVLDDILPPTATGHWEEVWIKSAEACRDIAVSDALSSVRRVQHAALFGAVASVRQGYRPKSQEQRQFIALTWMAGRYKPEFKVYAKRTDLLRLELACGDREAVVALSGRKSVATTMEQMRKVLRKFVWDAAPEVDRLEQHVRRSLQSAPDLVRLMVALARLSALAAGLKVGAGPLAKEVSMQAANDALGGFLDTGQYDVAHLPEGHAIRTTLNRLASEGGPLIHRRHSSVYLLDPALAASAQTLLGMANAANVPAMSAENDD